MPTDTGSGYTGGQITFGGGSSSKVPAAPTYHGAAGATAPSSSSKNPDDIFGLGDLYNQPIYLGQGVYESHGTGRQGPVTSAPTKANRYGSTQDIMANATKLFGQQDAERAKHPHELTGYEQLQKELWQAGFYGQTSFDSVHVGQWTSQTQSALHDAIKSYEAVSRGGQLPETFTEFVAANQAGVSAGGQQAKSSGSGSSGPPPVNLADPDSIKAAAQSAAMTALGQGLSDDQLNAFVSQFQQAQQSAHNAAYADGSTQYSDPNLSDEAAAYAQKADPGAYQQNQHQAYMDALVNLFAGPGATARPSINVTPKV